MVKQLAVSLGLVCGFSFAQGGTVFEGQIGRTGAAPIELSVQVSLYDQWEGATQVFATHEDRDPDTTVDPEYQCHTRLSIPAGLVEAQVQVGQKTYRVRSEAVWYLENVSESETPLVCEEHDLSGTQTLWFSTDLGTELEVDSGPEGRRYINPHSLLLKHLSAKLAKTPQGYRIVDVNTNELLNQTRAVVPVYSATSGSVVDNLVMIRRVADLP